MSGSGLIAHSYRSPAYKNIQSKNKASKQQEPEEADAQEDEQDAEPEPLVNDEFDAAVLSE